MRFAPPIHRSALRPHSGARILVVVGCALGGLSACEPGVISEGGRGGPVVDLTDDPAGGAGGLGGVGGPGGAGGAGAAGGAGGNSARTDDAAVGPGTDAGPEDAQPGGAGGEPDPPAPRCGDGTCAGTETCDTCAADCGPCGPVCGDGACAPPEACDTCAADCGPCAPVCGDGACAPPEACDTCAADCGPCAPVCGDGLCAAAETCDGCPADCGSCDWPEDLARSEDALLALLNAQRAQGANCGGVPMPPVPPLRMNDALREAARLHSLDMAQQNYFDHDGRDGSSFSGRAGRAGYTGFAGGENIAAGNATAEATFGQWLRSPGHCRNMLEGRFNEIGVGHAYERVSEWGHYWTQVFGTGP